jgi:hypothetical protein
MPVDYEARLHAQMMAFSRGDPCVSAHF